MTRTGTLSRVPGILLAFAFTLPIVLRAESTRLTDVIALARSGVDPERAMRVMRTVYSTDRFFTFPAFEKTAAYLQNAMRSIGLEQIEIVQTPADGVTQAGFWTMPLAWDVSSARLELLDSTVAAEERILADYPRIPASVGMWSGPTSKGGIEAEVVAVSKAQLQNPGKLDLKGKLALLDVNPAGYKWALVKAGALGAINTFTENPSLQDGRQWINAWGDSGWAYTRTSTPLLSFSITPRQAKLVRQRLQHGAVRVRATVNARHYEGSYPYVTGVVQGTGDEEVLALALTSEQGAHDNATGVAATLEAVTAINRLIAERKLQRPRRSIRVLLMGEMYGSMHYVATNPARIRRTVAALCVDTPAASYDLAGTEYSFYMNPHVAKSFTDALILGVASSYFPIVKRPWHEKDFATGTDTYLGEPMVGIPTVWSYSGSGVETHHNSEDTPDRVDPRSLRDLSVVTAAFLYYAANAGEAEAPWLAGLSETRGYSQILKYFESGVQELSRSKTLEELKHALWSAGDRIKYSVEREQQAARSVLRLVPEGGRAALVNQIQPGMDRLHRFGDAQTARIQNAAIALARERGWNGTVEPQRSVRPDAAEAAAMVVRRKRFGTIPLDDIPQEQWEGQPSGAWALVPTIALYWCDGKRNLAEVIRLTEAELDSSDFDYVAYFKFLRKRGYVEFIGL